MAITLPTASRNASAAAVVALVDGGPAAGRCEILSATDVVLLSFTLSDPAFGAPSTGTSSAASLPKTTTGLAADTATKMRVVDSTGAVVWSGTAGTTGTDAILDNAVIAAGQTANLTALSYTQPAGG